MFRRGQLDAVYSAWWFLLILAVPGDSAPRCASRATRRKILADLKTYKEDIRAQSLQAFGHARRGRCSTRRPTRRAKRIGQLLAGGGWKVKLQQRAPAARLDGGGAQAGGANKLGYIAAHSAIVLVCIGGLLDGDLIVRAQSCAAARRRTPAAA